MMRNGYGGSWEMLLEQSYGDACKTKASKI